MDLIRILIKTFKSMEGKMRYTVFFIISVFLLINCSELSTDDSGQVLPDVLSLELSFGDDDTVLPEEYLLARPGRPVILDNGDILVGDENSIKVFDGDGKPRRIIGRAGQPDPAARVRVGSVWPYSAASGHQVAF